MGALDEAAQPWYFSGKEIRGNTAAQEIRGNTAAQEIRGNTAARWISLFTLKGTHAFLRDPSHDALRG
jgi:hypothetical protein